MKTFPGWREVGRAMRWARKQEEVQGPHVKDLPFGRRYAWGWRADGQVVTVTLTWGISYSCSGRGPRTFRLDNLDAVEVLRVLAALGLIRADRLNGPMVARLRKCAADTSPNWDGAITIYPPEARELVALIDRKAVAPC